MASRVAGTEDLGRSDAPVLILGTAQLTERYGITANHGARRSFEEACELLRVARGLGISTLDTAAVYGDAEQVIGGCAPDFAVHTKIAPGMEPRASLQSSLGKLQRERVDVLYVHDVAALQGGPEFARKLNSVRGDGADSIGASIYEPNDLDRIDPSLEVDVVQVPMNVFDRRFGSEFVAAQRELGRRVIARSVFLQGLLVTDGSRNSSSAAVRALSSHVEDFHQRCYECGLDPLTACLAWVRRQAGVHGVIVGVQSEEELRRLVVAWAAAGDAETSAFVGLTPPPTELIDPRSW